MKKYGLISDFALIRKDMSRMVIGYGLTPEEDGEHATWHEVVIYKKKVANPSIEQVKEAVVGNINKRTDGRILSGFTWNNKPVWLSEENQKNFSEAQRIAVMTEGQSLPVKFKLGEDENGNPVYHTFTAVNSINQFYLSAVAYIQGCLTDGWEEKDSIEWSEYEEALENPVIDGFPEPEPEPSEDEGDVPSEPADGEPQEESSDNPSEESDEPSEEEEEVPSEESNESEEPTEEESDNTDEPSEDNTEETQEEPSESEEEEPSDEEPEAEEPAEPTEEPSNEEEPEPSEPSDEAEEESTEEPSEEEETT